MKRLGGGEGIAQGHAVKGMRTWGGGVCRLPYSGRNTHQKKGERALEVDVRFEEGLEE